MLPHLTHEQRQFARRLRVEQTDCELHLWQKIRARQLLNLKFRRQHPCPPFVLDFYCVELKLAIELDGGQHFDAQSLVCDRRRTAYLQGLGITVLRFDNRQVLEQMNEVLEEVYRVAGRMLKAPSPQPSPSGRGS
ncbi:MAG: DUF559 domain-containing protein [Pseudomonas helleri]|jgi:very-short-patch-repair endonuclease|uniref:DUF559 domain-containing protein n=1 Tax=Pseudomonas helleri TaxID=1608996 RepID=A0A6A7ZAT1_9PSED|nr:endonuclease domain-containing protein [Pseudomonas helleri]MQT36201.1 DUF559 domain-containing protein [Pseudomonas helleri]MQU21040.1 DUF559 domain-containing protein [Pseudomonas helleri]MQU42195.1 DUF559 domain-containing protein [Pseudomonas helleri]MQU59143.1 DUF559 domain-containing protein [Pseudomonas helleri]